jgi:hypothetical protein
MKEKLPSLLASK